VLCESLFEFTRKHIRSGVLGESFVRDFKYTSFYHHISVTILVGVSFWWYKNQHPKIGIKKRDEQGYKAVFWQAGEKKGVL